MSSSGGVSDLLVEKIRLAGLLLMVVTAFKLAGESLVLLSFRDEKHDELNRHAALGRRAYLTRGDIHPA